MKSNAEAYEGPGGIILEIDEAHIDTPAMVYSPGRRFSSTYGCALFEQCIDDVFDLSVDQLWWLGSFEDEVDEAFEVARAGNPDYN